MTLKHTNEELEKILNQFIVFGQKQQPFSCARCGAQTDDKSWGYCWCTDRDSSSSASSPTWIDNVNYPRFAEAHSKALQAINELMISKEEVLRAIGEDETPPIGEQGKFDPDTRTYELITDSEAVKYHIQRVMNQNALRAEIRQKLNLKPEKK